MFLFNNNYWRSLPINVYRSTSIFFNFLFFFLKLIYWFQLGDNYFTILWWFLPHVNMNWPRVYMCPPSWNPLLPPSPRIPLGCLWALALGVLLHASNLHQSSVLHMIMCMLQCYFYQIIPPSPSPTESKSVLYISFSFAALHVGSSVPFS